MLITKGAPNVLHSNTDGHGCCGFGRRDPQRILAHIAELSDALRTLSVAYRLIAKGEQVEPTDATEHDLIYVGTVGIIDPPRPEAAVAIADAHRAEIRVIMIIGDHPAPLISDSSISP
jgi:magnesium-transporting ATPase (P-type)